MRVEKLRRDEVLDEAAVRRREKALREIERIAKESGGVATMTDLPKLSKLPADSDQQDFLYHVKEIFEAVDSLGDHLRKWDNRVGQSASQLDRTLADIEIELFTHIQYHLDEAKPIFRRILVEHYGSEEGVMEDDPG